MITNPRNDTQTTPLARRDHGDAASALSSEVLTRQALRRLMETRPEYSARQVFTTAQVVVALLAASFTAWGFFRDATSAWTVVNAALTTFFVGNFLFKMLLLPLGRRTSEAPLAHDDLPGYSLLIPMYREPEVIPQLVASMKALDYPAHLLDIKLILEEDDAETRRALGGIALDERFEVVLVPPSQPKTKPKALNYALPLCRGELIAIYDAEDRPDPLQLKKAVGLFRASPTNVACVQARLNFYNPRDNWLARLFTLEYSLWFDHFLPGLERMGVPLPLGGTSNHFKAEALEAAGAWDPYNTTEDADLGIRLGQLGYATRMLDSTTLEEANVDLGNWIRQRSRWCKGYMQTWLVHMRSPARTFKRSGFLGFFSLQFFVGGTVLANLGLPFVHTLFALWLMRGAEPVSGLFPGPLGSMALTSLLVGNTFFILAFAWAGLKRSSVRDIAPWALTAPLYWALASVAAYKGLWQLFTRPFYWEKTQHGLGHQQD